MKPKIVFYNPASNASGKKILPMSLLALGAVLEGKYTYSIVDGNVERDVSSALRREIQNGANVLAITVMPGPQLKRAAPHSRALKQEFPNLKIVWGGYFPTQHAETVLKDAAIDFVVRGHGEMVFLNLLDALADETAFNPIEGLAFRDADGRIVQNKLAPLPHPEQLPAWRYERVDVPQYLRPTFLGSRTLPHHSSYGCPFFCNFCAVVNMVNGRWLPQSAARVAEIARRYVEDWGVNAIEFYDNNFFTHEARTAEFAERVLDLNIHWWGEARIDALLKYSERSWQLMRDAGLKMVFMGAESGSLETLKRMDKGGTMSPAKTLEIAHKMERYGIVPEFSFVLGSPPDPESDVRDTIEFIRRVKTVNPRSEIIMYNYTPVPLAGDLYDAAQAQGFRFPETLDEWLSDAWMNFSQRYSDVMPWLKPALKQRVRNFERVLNAYYPTSTDRRLSGGMRTLLRGASAWRYHTRLYSFPIELRALQKVVHYQRPETSGF
ncbi:MAG: cobalamin B12-binding domain-containing protein [Chloroflexi bacterium]|nr:cobalamin B12-binding domain-containing protein [Chloroflexota bacterium]